MSLPVASQRSVSVGADGRRGLRAVPRQAQVLDRAGDEKKQEVIVEVFLHTFYSPGTRSIFTILCYIHIGIGISFPLPGFDPGAPWPR